MDFPSTSHYNPSSNHEMRAEWLSSTVNEMTYPIRVIRKNFMKNYKRNKKMAWIQLLQILAHAANSRLSLESLSILDIETLKYSYYADVVNSLNHDAIGHENRIFKLNTCYLINYICLKKSRKRSKLYNKIISTLKDFSDDDSPESLRYIGLMTLVTIMTSLAQKLYRPKDYVRKWHFMKICSQRVRDLRYTFKFGDIFEYIYEPIEEYLNLPTELRLMCFEGLKYCIKSFPQEFVSGRILPYIVHGVSDNCPEIKLKCIRLLKAMTNYLPGIVEDASRIISIVLKELGDENHNIVLTAIKLVFKLHDQLNVNPETKFDFHDVAKALYSNNVDVRQAGMNLTVKLLFKDLSADTIADDVLSFFRHAQDNGKSEQLIDALFNYLNEKMIIDRIMDHLLSPLDGKFLPEPEIEMLYIEFVLELVKRASRIPFKTANDVKYSRNIKKILRASVPLLLRKYGNYLEILYKIELIKMYL